MTLFLLRHLLESTCFAAVALIFVAVLRNRSAATRHTILLAAVAKFALPLQWLAVLGAALRPHIPLTSITLPMTVLTVTSAPSAHNWSALIRTLIFIAISVWIAVALIHLSLWLRRLLVPFTAGPSSNLDDLQTLERMRNRIGLNSAVRLQEASDNGEPRLTGLFRPAITLSANLSQQLSQREFEAVLLHELAHAKRHDNLTRSFVHVLACIFWFHPLLWWLEDRIDTECELACDQMVLNAGTHPQVYLDGILKICHLCLLQSIPGCSNVTGSNLKHRMEQIMSSTIRNTDSRILKALGPALLATTLAATATLGFFASNPVQAQSTASADTSAAEQKPTDKPMKVSGEVIAGLIIHKTTPVYPPEAREAKKSGTVVLHAVISKTGTVENLSVISGPKEFRRASLEAVQTWLYKPYLLNGDPTAVDTTITISFSLS